MVRYYKCKIFNMQNMVIHKTKNILLYRMYKFFWCGLCSTFSLNNIKEI